MSEVLSKAERENIVAHVGLMAPWDHMGGTLKAWVGDYEATLCQAEADHAETVCQLEAGIVNEKRKLARALRERDELRRHLKALHTVSDAVAAMP